MLIFDAHLDLSMNALEWNRDLTRPILEIREREKSLPDKPDRGRGTVCLPEMRQGEVGICVATQIARYVKTSNRLSGWHSPQQAWAQTQGQLAWYRALEELGELRQISDLAGLEDHLISWNAPEAESAPDRGRFQTLPQPQGQHFRLKEGAEKSGPPIGYILSLEGADSIITLGHLEKAYAQGLRAVGPAHYGPGTYAQGTDASGGLGSRGLELVKEMERLGIILDVTHLCDESFWEALDHFQGPIWASHSNCRALVPHNRQFDDDQLKELIRRGAVIGAVLDAWMLAPGWIRGQSTPVSSGIKLSQVVDHIDHVCQLAGNARHSGIGSDLDGAFGKEQSPSDLETIADLARIADLLSDRGYTQENVRQIMHGNFLAFLRRGWGAREP